MSILLDESSCVLVQGITGHQGRFHTKASLAYGTKIVAGVTPGKGGTEVHGVPVFEAVQEAVDATGADTSLFLVPAPYAKDAAIEAIESGIRLLVLVTERIPFHDALDIVAYARIRGTTVIGPNCPGIISPGRSKVGIMPGHIFQPGRVGVLSRSGTLTYEIVNAITEAGEGQSTAIGIGGDAIIGMNFVEGLRLLEDDEETERIVLVGEIGGTAEEEAAAFMTDHVNKPAVAYVAGQTAPPGRRMGHAGAIISRGKGTARSKIEAFRRAGVPVAGVPSQVPSLIAAT
ncbi:MAG: succinate--CoA ligase subunit alpha [Candidatus Thermoplasmatota archaeon]|nr:succinate--CoA ligase subunit alpha [Candidatus Thermoplasmatota archaeon]